MKKFLFIIPSFTHGGTNRSFCNIIDIFGFEKHGISADILCVMDNSVGTYKKEYQKRNLTILAENKILSSIFYSGNNIFLRIVRKVFKSLPKATKDWFVKQLCRQYNNKYDAVVAMQEGITTEMVSYIKAPHKIAWLRFMYDLYYTNYSNCNDSIYYDKIDSIVCVSEACRNSLLKIYPQYENNAVCIPNTQNSKEILKKSCEETDVLLAADTFNILSVGRFDKIKQFNLIPKIVSEITKRNCDLNWYIMGDGPAKEEINSEIEKYNLENSVHLIDSHSNPYPIMKQADMVAVTSFSESFCNVIAEAEILGVPVITTDFPAAFDTLKNKAQGVICPIEKFSSNICDIIKSERFNKLCNVPLSDEYIDSEEKQFAQKLEKVFCQ